MKRPADKEKEAAKGDDEDKTSSEESEADEPEAESKQKQPSDAAKEAEAQVEEDDDDDIGPKLSEASEVPAKKRKVLDFEAAYLRNIPKAKCYEKSFMHRDTITHSFATKTDFIITISSDGHVKFWKKLHSEGVEFVKHFRAHLGAISDVSVSANGVLMCTAGVDSSVKVFDVINFDMINMIRLPFVPGKVCWIHRASDPIAALAVSEKESGKIHIYDGKGEAEPLRVLDKLHSKPVTAIQYNAAFECVLSVDEQGMLEYWTGPKHDYQFPTSVEWEFKTDTDLYTFVKLKMSPCCLCLSPDGRQFASWSHDRKVRVFNFATGKLTKVIDESLSTYQSNKSAHGLANTEFNRRLAVERELDRAPIQFALQTITFDESGHFLLYPSLVGIKVLNLKTNQVSRVIGKPETIRFLSVSLCRAMPSVREKLQGAATTAEAEASDNPALKQPDPDPMIVCTAYKKNRFYLFTNAEPFDAGDEDTTTDGKATTSADRDVLNERPQKQDTITAIHEETPERRVTDACVIHTTMGDIHCNLFSAKTPKTAENFCTHARRGYYNGHVFHRIIRSFMIQTGDPTGTGMGGESIWGGEFEDEIVPELKHDKPYTMSMANAGPNTNGSQFFITVVPTPWLDGKHTIFGRVVKGIDVVQQISKVMCNNKTGRPHDEIAIISITLK